MCFTHPLSTAVMTFQALLQVFLGHRNCYTHLLTSDKIFQSHTAAVSTSKTLHEGHRVMEFLPTKRPGS